MDNMDDMLFMHLASPNIMFNPSHNHSTTSGYSSNVEIKEENEIAETIHLNHEIDFNNAYHGCCHPIEVTRQIEQGTHIYEEMETLYINIPKGIDHNEIIVMKEKGNIKNKNKSDLKIHILLKRHELFERNGMNLIYKHEISFKESLLGFSFVLNHLNGQQLKLNNPKGKIILNKSINVLNDLGFVRENNKGKLILEFYVKQPDNLNEEQIKLIENAF